jgi:hypothetical protein
VALFGWKKSGGSDQPRTSTGIDGGASAGNGGTPGSGDVMAGFEPQPEKARVWFEYGRTAADSFNYEYALACYANGIKLDPAAMSAHEAMYEVAVKYLAKAGKPATGKEIKSIEDSTPLGKFAAAEFAWMKDIANPSLGLKALEAAVKAGQFEYGNWSANKVLGAIRRQKKLSKGMLVQAKDLFKEVSAWNEALAAGQLALQIDPSDNALDHELKDISAQRAMDQGGYERAAGKEGAFRQFVKNIDKQRELQEAEAIVTSETAEQRNLQRAKEQYEKNPKVPDSINIYAQMLKKQSTPQAEMLAYEIYMRGFKDTGEYRFKMAAGDVKVEQLRRDVELLESKAQNTPTDATIQSQLSAARSVLINTELVELNERVSKYPTDRYLRMRLGEIEFVSGNYEAAQLAFQAVKDEPKLRVRAAHMLGRCFAAESWHREAISEYKEALSAIDATEKDRELDIRYDLMVSLIEDARAERDANLAKEALEICSGIVRKSISYRDIRAKRKEVDQLIRDLTGGEAAQA